jgi:DNA gyrase subunit A
MEEGDPEYELRRYQERAHILDAVLRAIDQFDTVVAAVRSSDSADAARAALMDTLHLDDVQARTVAYMPVCQLARRELLTEEYKEAMCQIAKLESKLASG